MVELDNRVEENEDANVVRYVEDDRGDRLVLVKQQQTRVDHAEHEDHDENGQRFVCMQVHVPLGGDDLVVLAEDAQGLQSQACPRFPFSFFSSLCTTR